MAVRLSRDSFDKDAASYIERVSALTTITARTTHIRLWIARFHGRRRSTITSAEIRGQRDTWLLEGLAPHTVNLRLRALSNLWTVLDGRRAPNPVREVPEATEREPEPRAVPYWLALRVVDRYNPEARRNAAIMRVIVTTGLAPIEIARLQPVDWRGDTLFVQSRQKGHGGASRLIQLTDAGKQALAGLATAQAWGRFPNWRSSRQFKRAVRSVARDPLTIDDGLRAHLLTLKPYDLRHSYATKLYLESGDAHAAAYVLGHRSKSTTARYIASAMEARAARAVHLMGTEVASEAWQPAEVVITQKVSRA